MIIAGSVQFYLLLRAQDEQESFNAWEGFFKERKNSFFINGGRFMLISLTSLVSMCKTQKNFYSKMRLK